MPPSLQQLVLGQSRTRRRVWPALAVVLFVATFAAYAVGVFHVSGGVVLVPGHAALVGLLAAGAVGYARGGLAFAWLVAFGALLGERADHAFFGLSGRSRVEQAAYFLQPEGLVVFAVMGVVLGTLAFAGGALVRWSGDTLRGDPAGID